MISFNRIWEWVYKLKHYCCANKKLNLTLFFFPMNLYSESVDGSIKTVEKETSVAKETKRKPTTKRQSKKVDVVSNETDATAEVVLETQQDDDETYETLVKELETIVDEPNVAGTDDIGEPEDVDCTNDEPDPIDDVSNEPIKEPVVVKKPKRKPRVPKNVVPTTPPPSPQSNLDDNEPPKWFMNYVSGMKNFQNQVSEKSMKKTKRVLKDEADDYAKEQWKKPDLRQRVTDNVDSHLTKMYRQIFTNRA